MAVTSPQKAVIGAPQRPLRRGVGNAILGGVCGGLAIRLGVKERTIRIAMSVLALVSGIGLLVYMMMWLALRRFGENDTIFQRLFVRRRQLLRTLLGIVVVGILLGVFYGVALPNAGIYTWPILLSIVAMVGVWHSASPDERQHLQELIRSAPFLKVSSNQHRKGLWLRALIGGVLVLVGLRLLTRFHGFWGGATPELFGALIVILGAFVLFAPWWLETLSQLTSERRERVRVEERAKVVAHLHDSVLQTLTLIERAASDESSVVRLARNQERELRQWLFNPNYVSGKAADATFATGLLALQTEIESDYGVTVELVTVGDHAMNEDLDALIAAGREAAINAARWSGASSIAIYGEVDATTVSLFVRDQGTGFDVSTIPDDRHGIALSIRERMSQHNGAAEVRSTLGSGTEVQLSLPLPTKVS